VPEMTKVIIMAHLLALFSYLCLSSKLNLVILLLLYEKFPIPAFEGKTRGVDSGVGILFLDPIEKLYYLRGVSTVYEENVNSTINLFTDIQFFLPWMRRTGVLRRTIVI